MAARIADRYGVSTLEVVVDGLRAHRSHHEIAAEVGVSHQRVSTWAQVLGTLIVVYKPHPFIEEIAKEKGPVLRVV